MKKLVLINLIVWMIFSSCTKKEGEGGTASISGSVLVTLVSDDFQNVYAQYPDQARDVYIVYGDDPYYSDKTETHYDGTYHFGYLRKGKYQIYSYSDDASGQSVSGVVPIIREVEITKNGQMVEPAVIEVYDQVTTYEGSSTIKGKLFAYDWNSELTILKDSFYVKNEYVYIARRGDDYYFERIRTYYDGTFVFPSLPMGDYEIYAYSRDITQQDPQDEIPIIINALIEENKQFIDVGRLDIID